MRETPMRNTILEAIDNLRRVLPEGASINLSIWEDHFVVNLHNAGEWLRAQGAREGAWYAFMEEEGRCQRNLDLDLDGLPVRGIETNLELGLTVEECRGVEAAA